jgi:predicted nucleic acid-binding protein
MMAAGSRLVFVDANVLIAAARGNQEVSALALDILADPALRFASSPLVRLEVLPKPIFHHRQEEVAFYIAFFEQVAAWAAVTDDLLVTAYEEAGRAGLSAMDALHVASAAAVGADEFVTAEKLDKPLHRTTLIPVRTLHP